MLREEILLIRRNWKYLIQHVVLFSYSATYTPPEIGRVVSHFRHIYECCWPNSVILFNAINQSIYFILGVSTSSHLVVCTWTCIISKCLTIFRAEDRDMCSVPILFAYACMQMCKFFARNIFTFLVSITIWQNDTEIVVRFPAGAAPGLWSASCPDRFTPEEWTFAIHYIGDSVDPRVLLLLSIGPRWLMPQMFCSHIGLLYYS